MVACRHYYYYYFYIKAREREPIRNSQSIFELEKPRTRLAHAERHIQQQQFFRNHTNKNPIYFSGCTLPERWLH